MQKIKNNIGVISYLTICILLLIGILRPWYWSHKSAQVTVSNSFWQHSTYIDTPKGYYMTEYQYIDGDIPDEQFLVITLKKNK